MKIEDYKKAVSRMHTRPELKMEVMKMSEEKTKKKFSKKAIIPIAIAATVCLSTLTAVFAEDIVGFFRKSDNLEMNIPSISENNSSEEVTSLPVKKAIRKKWDEDVIKNLFIGDKPIALNETYESNYDPDMDRKWIEFQDNSRLGYEDGDLNWEYGDWLNYSYSYHISVLENLNFEKSSGKTPFKEADIEGLDKNECAALADSYVEQLGISVNGKQIFTFDKESLISEDNGRNENGERIYKHGEVLPEWTEEQEAYLFVYNICADDVSLTLSGEINTAGKLEIVVGRNGLASFEARKILDPVEDIETVNICPAENAADAVYKFFDKEPSGSPMKIENYKLVYRTEGVDEEGIYFLKPCWEFYSTAFVTWTNPDGTLNEGFEKGYIIDVDPQTEEVIKNVINMP